MLSAVEVVLVWTCGLGRSSSRGKQHEPVLVAAGKVQIACAAIIAQTADPLRGGPQCRSSLGLSLIHI
eukprot:1091275-Amphidinium_carterae.1